MLGEEGESGQDTSISLRGDNSNSDQYLVPYLYSHQNKQSDQRCSRSWLNSTNVNYRELMMHKLACLQKVLRETTSPMLLNFCTSASNSSVQFAQQIEIL